MFIAESVREQKFQNRRVFSKVTSRKVVVSCTIRLFRSVVARRTKLHRCTRNFSTAWRRALLAAAKCILSSCARLSVRPSVTSCSIKKAKRKITLRTRTLHISPWAVVFAVSKYLGETLLQESFLTAAPNVGVVG